jgi:molybdenum cofactor sulfurtransferase
MDEAACISYNNAVEELRAREYPMLQGKFRLEHERAKAYTEQILPILTMLGPHSTRNR